MIQDQLMRKLIRPVDARGLRGVFSRGKPVYGSGSNTPNALGNKLKPKFNLNEAILNRYKLK